MVCRRRRARDADAIVRQRALMETLPIASSRQTPRKASGREPKPHDNPKYSLAVRQAFRSPMPDLEMPAPYPVRVRWLWNSQLQRAEACANRSRYFPDCSKRTIGFVDVYGRTEIGESLGRLDLLCVSDAPVHVGDG